MKRANQIFVFLLVAAMSLIAAQPTRAGLQSGLQSGHPVEICDEGAIQIIYIDDRGQEVPADPICDCIACPHGIVPSLARLPDALIVPAKPRSSHLVEPLPVRTRLTWPPRPLRAPRGPPVPKAIA